MLATIGGSSARGFGFGSFSVASGWEGVIDEVKLPVIDLAANYNFGEDSRISGNGNYIVVGSQGDADNGSNAGAAYVFVRSGSTWSQQAKLFPSDIQGLDLFGSHVDISADASYVIGTSRGEDGGAGDPLTSAGAAYIFNRTGDSWTQQAKIVSSDLAAADVFGENCCINADGTYAVVVADGKAVGGAAYVFKRSGSTWSQEAKLIASNTSSGDIFGFGLAINSDGTYIAVGAPNEDTGTSNAGMVYVFSRSGSTWTEEAQIQSSPVNSSDTFGKGIAINDAGDVLAVGAYQYDDAFTNEGSVLIYTRSGTTWTQQQRIGASVKSATQYFGAAIDMDSSGDIVAITADGDDGQRGAVYVFSKNGGTYTETTKLVASDTYSGQRLGGVQFTGRHQSIGISSNGGDIVVGASLDDGVASNAGTAYVFSASGLPSSTNSNTVIGSVSHNQRFASHNSTQISTTATLNAGYSDRQMWVVVPTMSTTGGGTTGATSATIGGNAMTLQRRVNQSSITNSVGIAWFKYTDNGALGTSASVVVNFGDTQIHSGIIVFDSSEATVETDFYGIEGAGNLADGAISTSASGWAAYCSITQNGSAGTQNDFGNILSFDAGTGEWVVFGYNSPASGGAQTIVDDPTGFSTARNAFCGLAMEP
jgi:hypothetical protein